MNEHSWQEEFFKALMQDRVHLVPVAEGYNGGLAYQISVVDEE